MMVHYQVWLDRLGNYTLVKGKLCDEPMFKRVGRLVHDFWANSPENAERIKNKAVADHRKAEALKAAGLVKKSK